MRRITITLPEDTARLLESIPEEDRGNVLARALRFREVLRQYAAHSDFADLDRRLQEGYLANAEENLRMSREWSPLDEEASKLLHDEED